MRGNNVEQLWYGLCLIEALVTLFVVSVAVLLIKQFLRCIPCNHVKRCSAKHSMTHTLGTVRPTRKAAGLDPGDIERRVG